MTKRMLIDATDPAETRVVVLGRNRVEEFDHEIKSKAQLKGNIYLAKVTRVEPSLQAAFVDYGGNRHGFLPFSEIHPDYYRIPIADREALLAEEAALKTAAEEVEDDEDLLPEREHEPVELEPAIEEELAAEDRAQAAEEARQDDRDAGERSEGLVKMLDEAAPQPWNEPLPDEGEAAAEAAPVAEEEAPAEEAPAEEAQADAFQAEETRGEEKSAESPAAEESPNEESGGEESRGEESRGDESGGEDSEGEDERGEEAEEPRGSGRSVPHVAEKGEQISMLPEEAAEQPEPEAKAAGDEEEPRSAAAERDDENHPDENHFEEPSPGEPSSDEHSPGESGGDKGRRPASRARAQAEENGESVEEVETEQQIDVVGGDEVEDAARRRAKLLRRYKIQEVIKRGQVMLVQVAKEERGNKGAALTTYLSLPGRYCVLMPNTARGGGISRKIGSAADRRRLKAVLGDLSIPDGMAVIVRTAGSERSKAEIKRDYEYLLRLWNEIRETTLASQAPALIYEEGNLVKRAIRDLYSSDTEEILVEGEEAYKAAKAFMRSLMPSHAKKVQLHKDTSSSLFLKYQVESQLAAMFDSTVQLRSGGYIVINVTEALVAIDVNSGKATRERHIEETALKTNIEAAEEVARQLRLRDLAGLIVIDFIDMEEPRHNREVERRLKEAMKSDRARIQLGRISPFGLLELSRQRLRPSLVETAMITCPHCQGTGRVYSAEAAALHILRSLAEEGNRRPGGELAVTVPTKVALFFLNQKREQLSEIESRYELTLRIEADDRLHGLEHRFERPGQTAREGRSERPRGRERERTATEERSAERAPEERSERSGERSSGRSSERRQRGRRQRQEEQPLPVEAEEAPAPEELPLEPVEAEAGSEATAPAPEAEGEEDRPRRRRRRGKRGGRRRGRRRPEDGLETQGEGEDGEYEEDDSGEEETLEHEGRQAAETQPEPARAEEESQPDTRPAVSEAEGAATPVAATQVEATQADSAGAEPTETPAPEEARQPQAEPEPQPAEPAAPADEPVKDEPVKAEAEPKPEPAQPSFDVITESDPSQPKRRGWWNRLVR